MAPQSNGMARAVLADDPCMAALWDPGPGFGIKAFTAREWDPETGLYYYRARYYDPKVGRFISEDPIRFAGGINFYTYVEDNPTNLTDPDGLNPLWWWRVAQNVWQTWRSFQSQKAAFNQAKRHMGIPTSQAPKACRPVQDRTGPWWNRPRWVREYDFEVPLPGGRMGTVTIRNDSWGHTFPDGGDLGPHFNTPDGQHFFY